MSKLRCSDPIKAVRHAYKMLAYYCPESTRQSSDSDTADFILGMDRTENLRKLHLTKIILFTHWFSQLKTQERCVNMTCFRSIFRSSGSKIAAKCSNQRQRIWSYSSLNILCQRLTSKLVKLFKCIQCIVLNDT